MLFLRCQTPVFPLNIAYPTYCGGEVLSAFQDLNVDTKVVARNGSRLEPREADGILLRSDESLCAKVGGLV